MSPSAERPHSAENSAAPLRVGVFGAGAIGCYLGARLAAAGCAVTLVGRGAGLASLAALRAVDLRGREIVPRVAPRATSDPAELAQVEVCLVTVKSQDTDGAAQALRDALPDSSLVVSFQNGLGNAARLREGGVRATVVAGMVTFNVVREDDARVRQTTSGPLVAGTTDDPRGAALLARLAAAFARGGEPLRLRADIDAVLAGKLLINLGNGLSAVTGLATAAALRSPAYRACLVACIREAQRVYAAAGVRVAAPGLLSPALVTTVLRVPSPLFELLARPVVTVDPSARSSTLQDLDRGRATEIDHLNGTIVALAERHGVDAPLNRWVCATVHSLERVARPLAFVTPDAMRATFERLAPR